jgi:hypothetical protein
MNKSYYLQIGNKWLPTKRYFDSGESEEEVVACTENKIMDCGDLGCENCVLCSLTFF